MNIKPPKSTRMGGHTIKVRMVPRMIETIGPAGRWGPREQLIEIAGDQNAQQIAETYLHELIEAANGLCDLKLEHRAIQQLAMMLHQALTDAK